MKASVFRAALILLAGALATAGADDEALRIVAQHRAVFTVPPSRVPTRGMADGPLLGNGDVGVVLAGPPEAQRFYVGKNDFWTRHPGDARVIHVGHLDLRIPALRGARYRQEQDLAQAEVRGQFTQDDVTVRTRSWVDAHQNLLFLQVSCEGAPIRFSVQLSSGAAEHVPARVLSAGPLNVGREQRAGGRWYFAGEMADLLITNVVLAGPPPPRSAQSDRYDGRSTWRALALPAADQAVSVGAWIKIAAADPVANFIVSQGEWNQGYSLGLVAGRLRWSVNGTYIESVDALATDPCGGHLRWPADVGLC